MGIYWKTIICTGFYSLSTTSTIATEGIERDEYIEDTKGILVFIPHTLYQSTAIDPLIEDHETKQGFVKMSDVIQAFKLAPNFFDITNEERSALLQKGSTSDDIKTWIVEYMYSTLGGMSEMKLQLVKMLPVV